MLFTMLHPFLFSKQPVFVCLEKVLYLVKFLNVSDCGLFVISAYVHPQPQFIFQRLCMPVQCNYLTDENLSVVERIEKPINI